VRFLNSAPIERPRHTWVVVLLAWPMNKTPQSLTGLSSRLNRLHYDIPRSVLAHRLTPFRWAFFYALLLHTVTIFLLYFIDICCSL
jgi:hypothetical protein